jgi:hypothetical protein
MGSRLDLGLGRLLVMEIVLCSIGLVVFVLNTAIGRIELGVWFRLYVETDRFSWLCS